MKDKKNNITFAQFCGPKNSLSPGGNLEFWSGLFPLPDEPDEPEKNINTYRKQLTNKTYLGIWTAMQKKNRQNDAVQNHKEILAFIFY